MATLILTLMGEDRAGLVEALADAIAKHDGNWEQSRMAHLANKFAGILLVHVPDEQLPSLQHALESMREHGLQITIEHGAEAEAATHRRLTLELLGQDHPGIMRDIAHALSRQGISI